LKIVILYEIYKVEPVSSDTPRDQGNVSTPRDQGNVSEYSGFTLVNRNAWGP